MSYIIPDPRFEMPELFEPNRMPVGQVEVDWSKSITNKLHSMYLWDSFHPVDITKRVPNSAIVVAGSTVELNSGSIGRCLDWDGSVSNQVTISDDGLPFEFMTGAAGEYSVLHRFTFTGNTSSANEFTLSATAASGGTLDSLIIGGQSGIEDGSPHTLLVTRTEADIVAFLDGSQIGTVSATAGRGGNHVIRYQSNIDTVEIYFGTLTSTQVMVAGTPQKTSDRWAGQIACSAFWQRELTPAEAISITNNYTQFLLPE